MDLVERGKLVGEGGEGGVYEVPGRPNLLVKCYHKPVPAQACDKLKWLASHASARVAAHAAWPVAVVSVAGGTGVLIPWVRNAFQMHLLYDAGSRATTFPDASWRSLVAAARETAAAVAAVHREGFLVADLNERNLLVDRGMKVTLIDCDSFLPQSGPDSFSGLGTELWRPPELGQQPSRVQRTPDHDNFSLAQMLFLLLFTGSLPLQPRVEGAPADTPRRFRFAYLGIKPHELPLDAVPDEVAAMFKAAFAPAGPGGKRPTAAAWAGSLERMEQSLRQCRQAGTHWHVQGKPCPWCALARVAGFDYFPAKARPKPAAAPVAPAGPAPAAPPPAPPVPPTPHAPPTPVTPPSPIAPPSGTPFFFPSPRPPRRKRLVSRPGLVIVAAIVGGLFWLWEHPQQLQAAEAVLGEAARAVSGAVGRPAAATPERQATDFIFGLVDQVNGPDQAAIAAMERSYPGLVYYFGKWTPHAGVMEDKVKYLIQRWPDRDYHIRPGSVSVSCNGARCDAAYISDFRVRHPNRSNSGAYQSRITIDLSGPTPLIVAEDGRGL